MTRRALQSLCLHEGAPQTKKNKAGKDVDVSLSEQIDWLAKNEKITRQLKEWAHEVRYVGNDGAHPGDNADVSQDDTTEMLELLESVTNVLYVAEHNFQKRRTGSKNE